MRRLLLSVLLALPATAVTVDRIAAVVDRQVITVSEITQMADLRFYARTGQSEDDYRHDVLDALIAQLLRHRDAERFGTQEIPVESVEARLSEIRGRFASPEEFESALAKTELTPDELRQRIKRELEVEAYVHERFAPLVFVSNEEIETFYRGAWSEDRKARDLAIPPLAAVRDEVRSAVRASRLRTEVDRWTAQLRDRASVDVYAWR